MHKKCNKNSGQDSAVSVPCRTARRWFSTTVLVSIMRCFGKNLYIDILFIHSSLIKSSIILLLLTALRIKKERTRQKHKKQRLSWHYLLFAVSPCYDYPKCTNGIVIGIRITGRIFSYSTSEIVSEVSGRSVFSLHTVWLWEYISRRPQVSRRIGFLTNQIIITLLLFNQSTDTFWLFVKLDFLFTLY